MEAEPLRQPVAEDMYQLVAAQRQLQQQFPSIFVPSTFPTSGECRQEKLCSPTFQISVKRKEGKL